MQVRNLRSLGLAGLIAGAFLTPTILAATAPEIHSVIEGRDPTSSRPLVVLQGRRLTRFKAFDLFESDGLTPAGLSQRISAKPDVVVLGLPANLPSGTYVLVASDGKGIDESLTVSIGNGRPLPASVSSAALDPDLRTDLDDATTLDGYPPGYFTNASNLATGTVSADRFSAYGDLVAEGKIGNGAGDVAAGDHDHDAAYQRKDLVGVKVSLSGQYNSTGGPEASLPFDIEEFDPQGAHAASAPTRLTCQQAGYYHAGGRLAFTANPIALTIKIRKNGTTTVSAATAEYGGGGTPIAEETSTVLWLDAGDYLEMVWPNNIPLRGGVAATEFHMVKLGE